MPLRREDLPSDPDRLAELALALAEENERRFCCKLSWRAERGLAAGFGQAAHWNSSATKAA
jgi:hypothetical protein